jgi:acyl-coenzyme A thioesterase PaaI-like protein
VCTAGLGASDDDWCGTLDLSIRSASPITQGPLVVSCQILRVGGRLITVTAELFDGGGLPEPARLAGTAVATLRRMPRNPKYNTNSPEPKRIGVVQDWGGATAGFEHHMLDEIGCVEISPGVVELIKSPYVTNSFGTVNGGTTGILVCAGAESAVGGGFVARDVEVRYVGQAGVGPVRTQCEILRIDDRHAVVDVTVLDVGGGRSAIAAASVTLTPPG